MQPGTIIYNGTSKKETPYLVRYIQKGDADTMAHYINTLSDEHTYIRFQGEKISLKEEQEYLEKQIKRVQEGYTVQLLCFTDNKLIGICDINMQDKIEKHIGILGLTVAKEYRSERIGKKLFELALTEASKNLKGLEIIQLGVFANNTLAQSLYKRYGFKEYGRLPEGIVQEQKYIDHIYMYKKIEVSSHNEQ